MGLKRLPNLGFKRHPHLDEPLDDSPFRQECTDNAQLWKLYMHTAKVFDKNLADLFNSDLDPLLIFAALFSAILAAFLIETRKDLQPDPQSITNGLLFAMLKNQVNTSTPQIPELDPFTPTSAARWINGLWFCSLMFSLMSALGASMAKGWVTQFSSAVSGSAWADARLHASRYRGIKRWQLGLIIQCLPILIHIAFLLFSIGLVLLVLQDDQMIGLTILALTTLVVLLYIGNSVHPAVYLDSPFRAPISGMIRAIFHNRQGWSWSPAGASQFPAREDAQKAQAICWLLTQSASSSTATIAIHAVAGLPCSLFVQNELCRSSVGNMVLDLLSEEMTNPEPDTDLLNVCLHALLRLTQAAPPELLITEFAQYLRRLVAPRGLLDDLAGLPAIIQDLALCIKARIIQLFCDPSQHIELFQQNTALFEIDLPVLAKSCSDPYIRRLLIEVWFISDQNPPPTSHPPALHFNIGLKAAHFGDRLATHSSLAKKVNTGMAC
ncbi:hypothetical protein R3P38DRAFT_3175619 [Favolaschia claudopus]|uniref:DUF6535 domain-containing protein n=1 Tax=Favolaschia claudopus TaxID=2862362 RepID=A0AAW0D3F5_9AGAR